MKATLILLGILAFVVSLVYLASVLTPPTHPMVGMDAPGLPGANVVLCVFLVGCPHCVEVAPIWAMLDGPVIGVSLSSEEETRGFVAQTGFPHPVVPGDQQFINEYHVESTPTTFLIHGGIVQDVIVGLPDGDDLDKLATFQEGAKL